MDQDQGEHAQQYYDDSIQDIRLLRSSAMGQCEACLRRLFWKAAIVSYEIVELFHCPGAASGRSSGIQPGALHCRKDDQGAHTLPLSPDSAGSMADFAFRCVAASECLMGIRENELESRSILNCEFKLVEKASKSLVLGKAIVHIPLEKMKSWQAQPRLDAATGVCRLPSAHGLRGATEAGPEHANLLCHLLHLPGTQPKTGSRCEVCLLHPHPAIAGTLTWAASLHSEDSYISFF